MKNNATQKYYTILNKKTNNKSKQPMESSFADWLIIRFTSQLIFRPIFQP